MVDRIWALMRLRALLLVVLATIGLQAAVPIRAPLERVEGSAFSSTTIDVAVISVRRDGAETIKALPAPLPALPVATVLALSAMADQALTHGIVQKTNARGPPPRAHPARRPESTAPPQP